MSGQRDDDQNHGHGGQSIEAAEGQEFDVVLADLPGAGYEWVLGEVPTGLALLSVDWAGPLPADAGASRPKAFRFSAEKPGSYDLVFDLVRPWEQSDVPPARQHSVTVEVAPQR